MFEGKSRKYFAPLKVFLKYGGLSIEGSERLLYKIYSVIILLFFLALYPFLVFTDLIKQRKFNDCVALWAYDIANMMDGLVIIYMYFMRNKLGRLIQKLEGDLFFTSKSREAEDIENKMLKTWFAFYKKQGITLLFISALTCIVPIIWTLAKRILSSSSNDWKLAWGTITFVNVSHSPNFELVWLYQNLVVFYIFINMVPLILIMIGVLAFLTVQLKILQAYLMRLVGPSIKEAKNGKNQLVTEDLHFHMKNAIDYHVTITTIAKEAEAVFHGPFFIMIMMTLVLLCLEGYRASLVSVTDAKILQIIVEGATAIFPVMMVCYYGEELAHNSNLVSKIAYEMDFVGTDNSFQKTLILMIRRSQKVIRMKAGGLVEISVDTMVWILRTSFSAYMMLRTLNAPQ